MVNRSGVNWPAEATEEMGGVRAIRWLDDGLELLDQRLLPGQTSYVRCDSARAVAEAISAMVVRGAPAIGVSAAYGAVLAARACYGASPAAWRGQFMADLEMLGAARPTAVNLRWALERMQAVAAGTSGDPSPALLEEARRIHHDDVTANHQMGDLGAALIGGHRAVLTHCNAGALATAGYGTALGVIRSAHRDGKIDMVFAGETRPWMQGARLTAWELAQDDIPVKLIADAAAGYALAQGEIGWVIVGADRVAANGDVANKIGTYSLAVSARHHGVGFMVVAPTSTIDRACATGGQIPIEERAAEELLHLGGQEFAARGVGAWNPVFDVTPAELVDVLVTENGVVRRPDAVSVAALFA